jgi:hypothetical protein
MTAKRAYWERRLVGVAVVVFALGCGDARSNCEIARDRVKECNDEIKASTTSPRVVGLPLDFTSCSKPASACAAGCVADSTCPAIAYVMLGRRSDPNAVIPAGANEFEGCINRCMSL